MSSELINRSPDLSRLRNEGYEVAIMGSHLVVTNVPYVDSSRIVRKGTLISTLKLTPDKQRTEKPDTHVASFIGSDPCEQSGTPIRSIQHSQGDNALEADLIANRSFSNKPPDGYPDYYEKMARYIKIISSPAMAIDPTVDPRTKRIIECSGLESPHVYDDTNSTRAEINAISAKLHGQRLAIIGVGGTGSHVLDLVCKTWVREIHLFDGDVFEQHTAFRSPGAASLATVQATPKKVEYYSRVYGAMHKGVFPHPHYVTSTNLRDLEGFDFVFVCIDNGDGDVKKEILEFLVAVNIPFVDCGLGIRNDNGKLAGTVRLTTVTPEKNDHRHSRIQFSPRAKDEYDTNIQTPELNMLNATMAVIKWKKLFGFYEDLENEFESKFTLRTNDLLNEETLA